MRADAHRPHPPRRPRPPAPPPHHPHWGAPRLGRGTGGRGGEGADVGTDGVDGWSEQDRGGKPSTFTPYPETVNAQTPEALSPDNGSAGGKPLNLET